MSEIYTTFIINNKFVRWETFNPLSTIQDVFNILKRKYDINKCIIEIGCVSILKNNRFNSTNVYEILVREKISYIRVTTKTKIQYLNSET
jgi:hypothetical protein